MASPFRTFRKNQKAWMVVLTILAMFSFVFFSNTGSRNAGPGGSQDPEVFTWKYGTVRQSEINNRVYQRKKVQEFLYRLGRAAEYPDAQLQNAIATIAPGSEPKVIDSILLEKKAKQLGIVVSDEMVRRFIRGWTQDKVSRNQLAQIIAELDSGRGGISQAQLFDGLRNDLAAFYAGQIFSPLMVRGQQGYYFFRGETPAERWDFYTRLNRKVTAEFLPVSVKDFVDKIPEPSPAELQSFYDQYKNDYPVATSPTPGFKQPYRALFDYVKADNAKLLEQALATVTEQEIKDHYEKYKDTLYKKGHLPDLPDKSDADTTAEGKKSEKDEKAADPAVKKDDASPSTSEEKSAPSESDAKKSASSETKSGDAKSNDATKTSKSSDTKFGKADAKSSGASQALESPTQSRRAQSPAIQNRATARNRLMANNPINSAH